MMSKVCNENDSSMVANTKKGLRLRSRLLGLGLKSKSSPLRFNCTDDQLPEGWKAGTYPSGAVYYHHTKSGERSWVRPKINSHPVHNKDER